jgi:hypothetical protein
MLPFGRLLYLEVREAVDYAKFYSRSHDAVIRVCDEAGNVIETHEHAGDFKEPEVSHAKQKAATQRSVTADCDQV